MGIGGSFSYNLVLLPPYTIRLSRVGGSFLENMCGHTVMPQMPWSAKYENQNFEKTFPFYKAYKNNLNKCQRIFTFKMYPNQVIAISVIQNPGWTQKQKIFLKIGQFGCVEKNIFRGYVLLRLWP